LPLAAKALLVIIGHATMNKDDTLGIASVSSFSHDLEVKTLS